MTTDERMAKARKAKAQKAVQRERDLQRERKAQLRLAERTVENCSRQYMKLEDHSIELAVTLQRRILGASAMIRYYKERLDA